jgi:hypothetical protein
MRCVGCLPCPDVTVSPGGRTKNINEQRQGKLVLTLPLFVARVLTNHHHATVTANYFALIANLFNARFYLHGVLCPLVF